MGYCVNYCPHTKDLCIVIELYNWLFKKPIVFRKKLKDVHFFIPHFWNENLSLVPGYIYKYHLKMFRSSCILFI